MPVTITDDLVIVIAVDGAERHPGPDELALGLLVLSYWFAADREVRTLSERGPLPSGLRAELRVETPCQATPLPIEREHETLLLALALARTCDEARLCETRELGWREGEAVAARLGCDRSELRARVDALEELSTSRFRSRGALIEARGEEVELRLAPRPWILQRVLAPSTLGASEP